MFNMNKNIQKVKKSNQGLLCFFDIKVNIDLKSNMLKILDRAATKTMAIPPPITAEMKLLNMMV